MTVLSPTAATSDRCGEELIITAKATKKTNGSTPAATKKRRSPVKQTDVPSMSVDDALRVARTLANEYGKQPTRPFDVAAAISMSPTSGPFRMLTGASIAYGFTEGGYNAEAISLTELGRRAVAPTEEGDDLRARREAFLKPRVINEFMNRFNGNPLPSEPIAKNILETCGVTAEATGDTLSLILAGAEGLGMIRQINGKRYGDVGPPSAGGTSVPVPAEAVEDIAESGTDRPDRPVLEGKQEPPVRASSPESKTRPNVLFVGHGKNKKPLTQLTKTLDQLGIPYKVAEDEPTMGRPISTKVRQTMEACGAGILIFSADREFQTTDGEPVWLSSENVPNELGAASVMYDNRVIIFKEEGVELASNYSGIGYIEFEKDKLDAKMPDLLKELVALKILRVAVGE